MGRPCSTCERPDVATINALLAAGKSQRSLCEEFGIARPSLRRHMEHVTSTRDVASGPTEPGPYELVALRVIEARMAKRGTDYEPQDELEAEHLLGTARMVDAKPDSPGAFVKCG